MVTAVTRRSIGALAIAAGIGLFAGGCTERQVYDSAGGWRQQECSKLVDAAERARCMETAAKDYDAYRKQR